MNTIIPVTCLKVVSSNYTVTINQGKKIRIFSTECTDYVMSQLFTRNIINSRILWQDYLDGEIIVRG